MAALQTAVIFAVGKAIVGDVEVNTIVFQFKVGHIPEGNGFTRQLQKLRVVGGAV